VYIAQPPLYKIVYNKIAHYAYSDVEKADILKKLGFDDVEVEPEQDGEDVADENLDETEEKAIKKSNKKPMIQRYKGLGEMNSEELWETTMDPKTRTLKSVSVEHAEEADKIFEMLMGNEVGPRKSFIQTHAKQANLDI
jgi:DNA gyrase subunit B